MAYRLEILANREFHSPLFCDGSGFASAITGSEFTKDGPRLMVLTIPALKAALTTWFTSFLSIPRTRRTKVMDVGCRVSSAQMRAVLGVTGSRVRLGQCLNWITSFSEQDSIRLSWYAKNAICHNRSFMSFPGALIVLISPSASWFISNFVRGDVQNADISVTAEWYDPSRGSMVTLPRSATVICVFWPDFNMRCTKSIRLVLDADELAVSVVLLVNPVNISFVYAGLKVADLLDVCYRRADRHQVITVVRNYQFWANIPLWWLKLRSFKLI